MIKKYNISIDCANCAMKIEEMFKKIGKENNINSLIINYYNQKMIIDYNSSIDIKNIEKLCKKIDSDFEIIK